MITTIIFDWGGVLTTGSFTKAVLNQLQDGRQVSTEVYKKFDHMLIEDLDLGMKTLAEFTEHVNQELGWNFTIEEMQKAFLEAIVPNEEVIAFAKSLTPAFTLVMLSDNEDETVSNLRRYYPEMLAMFSKKYFSYKVGFKKPDEKFFTYVLNDLNVDAEECIFIDDKQKNVDAAISCGMHGVRFESLAQLQKELKKRTMI